jgi:hypothetical protein
MIKFVMSLALIFVSLPSNAGYIGNQSISNLYGAGNIKFGINNPPSDTCGFYGRHFVFDATTKAGQNMLTILLAAKMANKNVDVWYIASTKKYIFCETYGKHRKSI